MAVDYSPEVCRKLQSAFAEAELARPMRVDRYEPGTELTYEVTGVCPARKARVHLEVDKFIGGGFAGQVYRIRVLEVDAEPPVGLEVGKLYAMKILVPPSRAAQKFRDAVYAVGFQAPFSQQVLPAAARAGALWQKLIRRAVGVRMGTERAVKDIIATFVDDRIGSCGEISEWVEGRNWRFEVDDRLDDRRKWRRGRAVDPEDLGSPEYRSKKQFMAEFVRLLHELGAPEFARQYEWWTCKSQPNVFKRSDTEDEPTRGLTAMDFRAGLALLPFMPMSPGDVVLIGRGIARGSLVQFDRGDLDKLQAFVDANAEHFADMREAMDELRRCERVYRDSMPDITHNHVRLLYSRRLWGTILDGAVTSWRVRNITDEKTSARLSNSRILMLTFWALGMLAPAGVLAGAALLIGGLIAGWATWPVIGTSLGLIIILPIAAKLLRTLWGRADYRRHYLKLLTSGRYFLRALRGKLAERLISWHRAGRINAVRAERLIDQPVRAFGHLLISWLPAGLHRMLTDRRFAAGKLAAIFVRPFRMMFNADAREQWLRDMIREGIAKGMLSEREAEGITLRIKEPFIQKYLKAMAVHVCTLPVTQVVSVIVALWYKVHYGLPWGEAWDEMLLILVAFQVIPISPGSFVRGSYVVYLAIRDRSIKDYNVAIFLGFFKYIGYLAFPVQMAYRYPALARFMAAHWATDFVHVVPVFGEHGALLEHGAFDLFYNRMLTIRRRMHARARLREGRAPRYWHAVPVVLLGAAVAAVTHWFCLETWRAAPTLSDAWPVTVLLPLILGALATRGAGGARLSRRILLALGCSAVAGVLYAAIGNLLAYGVGLAENVPSTIARWKQFGKTAAWGVFLYSLLGVIGAFIAETRRVKEQ